MKKRVVAIMIGLIIMVGCSKDLKKGEMRGEDILYYEKTEYIPIDGIANCGEKIGVIESIKGYIREVDKDKNFLVVENKDGRDVYMRKGYELKESGVPTDLYLNGEENDNDDLRNAIVEISNSKNQNYQKYSLKDISSKFKKIYVSYNDDKVGNVNNGYIGRVDGEWIYIPSLSKQPAVYDIKSNDSYVKGYKVDKKYEEILNKYIK